MDQPIKLKDTQPIAQGRMRYVYPHPGDPDLVIKIIRPDVIDQRWGSGQKWYKARRRFGQYISYMREIAEYVAAHARYGRNPLFAQQVVGLAETDLGLGLVLKAVRGKDGGLAPSVTTMLVNGTFDAAAEKALEKFIQELLESDIIVADLHGGNMVYAYDEERGHHFVMIDGLGQSNILPFKSVFRSFNRRSKLRHIARLRSRMDEIRRR